MRHLYVTLTDTTNPYLKPRLPLTGFIELFEGSTSQTIIAAVFRIEKPTRDGLDGGPVSIERPVFTYDHAIHPSDDTRRAFDRAVGK